MLLFTGGIIIGVIGAGLFLRRKIFLLNDARDGLREYSVRMRDLQDFWHEQTGDAFLLVDFEAKLLSMNPAARRMLGIGAEPVAGRPLSAFLKEDCAALAAIRGGMGKGPGLTRLAVRVRPVRTPEADRELVLRVFERDGALEAWIILRLAGG